MCDTDDMTNEETYERILEEARYDSEVLGFALTGRWKFNRFSNTETISVVEDGMRPTEVWSISSRIDVF